MAVTMRRLLILLAMLAASGVPAWALTDAETAAVKKAEATLNGITGSAALSVSDATVTSVQTNTNTHAQKIPIW